MKVERILVVTDRKDLPEVVEGAVVVDADAYLAGEGPTEEGLDVVNLCRRWTYLSRGYYVSLLADARGQFAVPTVSTLEALQNSHSVFRSLREAGVDVVETTELTARVRATRGARLGSDAPPLVRNDTDEEDVVTFRPAGADEQARVLVCMGRCEVPGFQRLASRVWKAWPAPLMRLGLLREDERWKVYDLEIVKLSSVTGVERAAALRALANPLSAEEGVAGRRRLSIAVLFDDSDPFKASSAETLDRFERIAGRRGIRVQRIGTGDVSRLGEHDALFIRTVTGIEEPAFRFALRAEALGMPVIDDQRSIIRCTNKVYLNELLSRAGLPTPKAVVVDRETSHEELERVLGNPYIVKLPDGSFSGAVFKITTPEQHATRTAELLRRSPLLLAQEFVPTPFDWRVTVLDGRVLFVCRYFMVPGHWQIRNQTNSGARYGRVDAVPRDEAPEDVVKLAVKAAKLIGDGLYGVDLKDVPGRGVVLIEVNDNPNVDVGYDDTADGDVVFEDLVSWFERRMPKEKVSVVKKKVRNPTASDTLDELRRPVGGRPPRRAPGRPFRAWEVLGLEIEHVVVDRDLNALSGVEQALAAFAGHPTSDVDLGLVGFSNEIFDHVVEIKTPAPLASLVRTQDVLVEGVRRMSMLLASELGARLLPGGMHPWLDPRQARLWRRSNRRVYDTYARLFDVHTHGWANVQATHVNLPMGRDEEAVAMMNAAAMLVPYLPAISAASPMFDGELQPAVDNRLAFVIEHQSRLPESSGRIVPEPIESLQAYKRDILGRMYKAVDKLDDAGQIRHEFLNARGSVFKFSRESMEIRVLDAQECVAMDVAIASFVRQALRSLARTVLEGAAVPDHAVLVSDFHAVVRDGTAARVRAPHLAPKATRADDGTVAVRDVLRDLLERAGRHLKKEEEPYLVRVEGIVEGGNLSEAVQRALRPFVHDDDLFTENARVIWRELSECLLEDRPWQGRESSATP